MKIGLVTITSGQNYGNRLQNYAMQTILEELGHDVETIPQEGTLLSTRQKLKLFVKKVSKYKYNKISRRIDSFKMFNKKHINFSKCIMGTKNFSQRANSKFDIFVCGSDQIWNPYIEKNQDEFYLTFAKKKKVAVAASFGVGHLEEGYKNKIKGALKDFYKISVREYEGIQIVNDLVNKEVVGLVDPTLVLTRKQWQDIEEKPKFDCSNYILIYLLGSYKKDFLDDLQNKVKYSGKNIVCLENDFSDLNISNTEEFSVNPSEFIWLIEHSCKVITDSFHAMVFSLIFRKDFLIIPRDTKLGNMSSRFHTLESIFNIRNYIYDKNRGIAQKVDVDYDYVEKIRLEERKKYVEFIKNYIC